MRLAEQARPRVLLVDDHRGMLDAIAATLADSAEIAGRATDGRQAIAMAAELAPDAIVLDITMPGLDGYQTKSGLDQAGSHAPVIFLSMLNSPEHVGEAFRVGGRGYVLKPHLTRDLPSALHHVLRGRRFVPSLPSLFQLADGAGHAMQLYRDPHAFIAGVADFFDLALRRGDATCVIATQDVRDGLRTRLQARGWDVDRVAGFPRLLVIDAAEAVDRVMRNGLPDPARVAEIASELDDYRVSASEGPDSRLTIFGNMVNVLTARSNPAAAIALEKEWNTLTSAMPFFTLCGYSTSCFRDVGGEHSEACAEHCTVSHAHGF